jgi:hypothetical protein
LKFGCMDFTRSLIQTGVNVGIRDASFVKQLERCKSKSEHLYYQNFNKQIDYQVQIFHVMHGRCKHKCQFPRLDCIA